MLARLLKPFKQLVCCLLPLALLSGCGTTRLFHANFQSDTPGALPQESPPGAPPGDLIWTSAADTHVLRVVEGGDLSSRNLLYRNADVPLYQRYVAFVSRPTPPASVQRLYAYWSGSIRDDAQGSALKIFLGNGHFLPLLELDFQGGLIRIRTSRVTPRTPPTYDTFGHYLEGRSHFILLSVDRPTQTYCVSFIQAGMPSLNTCGRPVLHPEALDTEVPSLYLFYAEEASGTGRYALDDVNISARPPEMPR